MAGISKPIGNANGIERRPRSIGKPKARRNDDVPTHREEPAGTENIAGIDREVLALDKVALPDRGRVEPAALENPAVLRVGVSERSGARLVWLAFEATSSNWFIPAV